MSPIATNPSTLDRCPRTVGLKLLDTDTGELINVRCNTYACEYCGKKMRQRLYSAIHGYIREWQYIRMWTFTVKSAVFRNNADVGNKLISKIWHTFITYCRRSSELSDVSRNFNYIKLLEFHQSGLPHLHVIVDRYLRWNVIQSLWEKAIRRYTDLSCHVGHCSVTFGTNAKGAARYVAKYVTKSASSTHRGTLHLWSKSGRGSIFYKRESTGTWIFISFRDHTYLRLILNRFRESAHPVTGNSRFHEHIPPFSDDDMRYMV